MRSILTLVLLLSATGADAQQTVFNVPSTDVLSRGEVYLELDAAFKPKGQTALAAFSSFVPRIVAGLGGNVEVGFNIQGNVQPGVDNTTLAPSIKWKFYENEDRNLSFVAGTNFYIPVRRRSYRVGTYTYLAGSKTIGKTRLTAGAFVASRNVFAPKAVRAGGQFAAEHAVNGKVSLAADWITGRHANGYLTPGVIYKPNAKVTTYWSYSISNSSASAGNHFFLFELGINLN